MHKYEVGFLKKQIENRGWGTSRRTAWWFKSEKTKKIE